MAKTFGSVKGEAKSDGTYKYSDGEQSLRFVGDILPRYLYWVENKIPFDCLRFDREDERWINGPDPVRDVFPDLKGSWGYMTRAYDKDGKLVVVPLKKKMFEQIVKLSQEMGDPSDAETGYEIFFEKKKTGPLAFNVDYVLNPIKIMRAGPKPLTEAQKAEISSVDPLEKIYPVPTPEKQAEDLRKYLAKSKEGEDDVDETVKKEFDVD